MTNTEIFYQIAQNIVDENLIDTKCSIADWRILDAGMYENTTSICFINDVLNYDNQHILQFEYSSVNHSGLGCSYWEEKINEEEIITDIKISEEVNKDYEVGDTIEYKLTHTIPYTALITLGFTYGDF